MKNLLLSVLRAKICGLAFASKTFRRKANKVKGIRRHSLLNDKRQIGLYSREYLIAYGLIRGIPYEKIENCSNQNHPCINKIYEIMLAHLPLQERNKLTLESVQALLKPTEKRLQK